MGNLLDELYFSYSNQIKTFFALTMIAYLSQQLFVKPAEATWITLLLRYLAGPLFILFLIATSIHSGTWFDEIVYGESTLKKIFALFYVVGSPIIALIGGRIITVLTSLHPRFLPFRLD